MSLRHFGLLLVPVAFYVWACSDDATSPDGGTDVDGGMPVDTGAPTDDGSQGELDGGDGGVVSCTGNPLSADGDAGVVINPDGGALKAIATGRFLDGPQWIDDGAGGAIVYSEVDSQTIVRNAPDGGERVPLRETGLNHLPIGNGHALGFIYTALSRTTGVGGGGGILRMLVDGGSPTGFDAGEANSPNDLVASTKGFVYFTDPGYQTNGISTGVFRLSPDGTVTTITKFDGGTGDRADGIALSRDESTLYVGFFDRKKVTKYTLDADGNASNPEAVPLTLADNPTGIAVDVGGNIWVAESPADVALSGRVEVFAPNGTKWGEIPFPGSRPTGVAFGGADGTTVYITTERGNVLNGTLFTMTSRCSGTR
jgi:sugar lactone lactonase YvrE